MTTIAASSGSPRSRRTSRLRARASSAGGVASTGQWMTSTVAPGKSSAVVSAVARLLAITRSGGVFEAMHSTQKGRRANRNRPLIRRSPTPRPSPTPLPWTVPGSIMSCCQ